jgi:upstream activation factor subunit UAF30
MAKKTVSEVSAPAPVPVPVETEVVKKAPRKPKVVAAESAAAAAPAVVPAPAPVEEPATDAVTMKVVEPAAPAEVSELTLKLQQLSALVSSIKADYKALEKKWSKDVKLALKQSSKRKRKAGNRAPSGFVKPTKISAELATFLGKELGSEMARTNVTREINSYIREHKLQDSENGRKINPDAKLVALLNLKKSDELTYFNLQKYLSPHFPKVAVEVATA